MPRPNGKNSRKNSMFARTSKARQAQAGNAKAKKDAQSTLPSSSESDLDSYDKNSVPVAATAAPTATLSDDDYVDESGGDFDGNSVKSGSRRQRQRRAGKAHTSEELLSEAADDTPEDSGSESDNNDRPPRSAAEVQRAVAVRLKANYRLGRRSTCAVCGGKWSFWGQPCGRTVEPTTTIITTMQLCIAA